MLWLLFHSIFRLLLFQAALVAYQSKYVHVLNNSNNCLLRLYFFIFHPLLFYFILCCRLIPLIFSSFHLCLFFCSLWRLHTYEPMKKGRGHNGIIQPTSYKTPPSPDAMDQSTVTFTSSQDPKLIPYYPPDSPEASFSQNFFHNLSDGALYMKPLGRGLHPAQPHRKYIYGAHSPTSFESQVWFAVFLQLDSCISLCHSDITGFQNYIGLSAIPLGWNGQAGSPLW